MNRIKGAFGLVEVLVALIFVSTSMIMSLRVVSKGLKIAKENEVRDIASGILIRALEYNQLDLPRKVKEKIKEPGTVFRVCYKLDTSLENSSNVLLSEIQSPCDEEELISSCSIDSPYYLPNTQGAQICNQILFTNLGPDNNPLNPMTDRIRITSVVIYHLNNKMQQERADTYRKI